MTVINCYKEKIKEGLKSEFGISVEDSALCSILSPEEFRLIVDQFKPADFSVGSRFNIAYNCFFKNVTNKKFRITLHAHTNFSDGRLTAEEFINQAAQYADKVVENLPNTDTRPPFVIALTDHDEIKGNIEIIKIIAQNPDKYKNLRFVSGAEIGSKVILDGEDKYFDLTALAVNPFDKELNDFIWQLKELRTKTVNDFIKKINKLTGDKYSLVKLKKLGFKGKITLINRSGLIYVEDTKNLLRELIIEKYGKSSPFIKQLEQIYLDGNYAYRDIPEAKDVISVVKRADGILSWTHPVRSFFKEDDLDWHENFFVNLKKLGVDGVEANHQYTYDQYQRINNIPKKNKLYRALAEKYNMFLSGGTDAHEYDIFTHHQPIDDDLLYDFLN